MSRLGRLDAATFRDWLSESDFHGVVLVKVDEDEEPLSIAMGLADRAAGPPIHAGTLRDRVDDEAPDRADGRPTRRPRSRSLRGPAGESR